jgi:DNA-binding NarL/FixJ family response regulator
MSGPARIRLLIADDHPVVRRGLTAMLEDQEDMMVVAEAADGPAAVAAYRQHAPDVALIDLRMPGLDGVEVVTAVRAGFPAAQVVILTTYDTDEDLYRAVRAGARGYLLKDACLEELADCVRRVSRGEIRMPAALAARLAGRVGAAELTPRELEVLQRMAAGHSNKEIAADLFVSEATVKTHVNHILAKLGCSDRTQAVTQAVRRGLVRLS